MLAEEAHRASFQQREDLQQGLAQTRQRLQVEQTKMDHASRVLEQFTQRQMRLTDVGGDNDLAQRLIV
jgi:hypothetical protein